MTQWRAGTDRKITGDAVFVARRYDAPVDAVWDAWTNPRRLSCWLGSVSGELRPGGEATLDMSPEIQVTCRITQCQAPHVLAVVWCHPGEPESAARVRLRADGDGTILEFEHGRLPAGLRVGYGYGWEDFLDRLGMLLGGGDPDSVSWEESQEVLGPLWAALALSVRRPTRGQRSSRSATSRAGATARYASSHSSAISAQSAGTSRRTPIQPRPPTYGGRKNRPGADARSSACAPGRPAHHRCGNWLS
jgi:uncharacterized protein YndB with AHSA1/START domain